MREQVVHRVINGKKFLVVSVVFSYACATQTVCCVNVRVRVCVLIEVLTWAPPGQGYQFISWKRPLRSVCGTAVEIPTTVRAESVQIRAQCTERIVPAVTVLLLPACRNYM